MEGPDAEAEVRLELNRHVRTLCTSGDAVEMIETLKLLTRYLCDGPNTEVSETLMKEFNRVHYTRILKFLASNLQADWLQRLNASQHRELWDRFFLCGPPDQSMLVLMDCIGTLSQSSGQDKVVDVLEQYLQTGRLTDLLWSRCKGSNSSDSPQLREILLGRLVSLPDITANHLHPHNRPLFLPDYYYPLLAREMNCALEKTCRALRGGQDCSLSFVAELLGKACIQGHSKLVFRELAPRLCANTRSDMVWQRVCWRLMENVPERWMESVVVGLVQAVDGPDALSRIMGNLVVKNKKVQFVVTHKLLLLQYKYESRVLRTLLGYLARDRERRPLLSQVLRALCQAWSSSSAVKHTPLEQQLYVSRCLLLCVGLLDDRELEELRADLRQCMLGGIQCRLDSAVVQIRRIGMVVGECLSSRLDAGGTQLKFEYDDDEEIRELLSMMDPHVPEEAVPSEEVVPADRPGNQCAEQKESAGSRGRPGSPLSSSPEHDPEGDGGSGSELDSDDELAPYDMSADQEMPTAAPPRYLRDCLEALMSSKDAARVELSLRAAEGLVRRNISAAREVGVELSKVLLHLEDSYCIPDFLALRRGAMVALVVTDTVPVVEFLTTEFYAVNYSLRQRLDVLEVLALSAQELSQPIIEQGRPPRGAQPISVVKPLDQNAPPLHWRQVVEQRIQSKTRRFAKGAASATGTAAPSRYAPLAGCFFFPLLCNYDRPQVTFDLMGSDHLVLGRLVHTLGLLTHLAVNAPVATQMGKALLDFVWNVRYHSDQVVRQGVLFAVCAVFLTMPAQHLLPELSDLLPETRAWLADMVEGDPDTDCRSLAAQALALLERSLRVSLEVPAEAPQA
ncbi:telomere length regulation protein TEL2 homolog isoform X2 [Brienomyrus brachyistius]|uniref:telomere length regulation protein TEL2 homolog isoform X2 n=1 Tax=Brienomyrus brachyistius TaxID=42636 RepID=UPI0020B1B999|nr:telomere length regulation protein TEL2 homolog isoform X2 [Brienomyrus brachyistius]